MTSVRLVCPPRKPACNSAICRHKNCCSKEVPKTYAVANTIAQKGREHDRHRGLKSKRTKQHWGARSRQGARGGGKGCAPGEKGVQSMGRGSELTKNRVLGHELEWGQQ